MAKISKPSLKVVSGTQRQVRFTWTWSQIKTTRAFRVWWEVYYPGTGGKKKGWQNISNSEVEKKDAVTSGPNSPLCGVEYTVPDDATAVRIKVKPLAEYKDAKNKKNPKWTAGWCTWKSHNFKKDAILPPDFTATLRDDAVTIDVEVSSDDPDCNFCDIWRFTSNKTSSTAKKKWNNKSTTNQKFKSTLKMAAGETWYLAARVKTAKSGGKTSEWTSIVTLSAKPATPQIQSAKALSESSAQVTWKAASGAKSYTVEYVIDSADYFKSNPGAVKSQSDIVGTTFSPTGLEAGHTYYFRVKAVNAKGEESGWSGSKSATLATQPDPPTTYETDSAYIVGEDVRFRWTHNSEDESEQTAYQISISAYDNTSTSLYKRESTKTELIRTDGSDGKFALPSDFVDFVEQREYTNAEKAILRWFLGTSVIVKSITVSADAGGIKATCRVPQESVKIDGGYGYIEGIFDTFQVSGKNYVEPFSYYSRSYEATLFYNSANDKDDKAKVDDNSRTFKLSDIADGTEVRWKVRTKGAHPNWSDWSTVRSFMVYERPSLQCTLYPSLPEGGVLPDPLDADENGNPLAHYPLVTRLDASGGGSLVAGYHVNIRVAREPVEYTDENGDDITLAVGETLFDKDYATTEDPCYIAIGIDDLALYDASYYTLTADVSMQSGLRATADAQEFLVDYDVKLPEPTASVTFDPDDLIAEIEPACYTVDDDGAATTTLAGNVKLAVYRVDQDGTVQLLERNIPNDGQRTVVDQHANFGRCFYRIAATDQATGVTSFDDAYGDSPHNTCVVQWDEDWKALSLDEQDDDDTSGVSFTGMRLDNIYNLQHGESTDPESEAVAYIGRRHPVSYYGTNVGYKADYQLEFPKTDTETLAKARRLLSYMGDFYVREPSGTGYWAMLTGRSLNRTYDSQAYQLTFTAERVARTDDQSAYYSAVEQAKVIAASAVEGGDE